MPALSCVYKIDQDDLITFVDDGWDRFAEENNASELVQSAVGQSIWNFISGTKVKLVYELLFARIRSTQKEFSFLYRCDSPTDRRYMELLISPLESQGLDFHSSLLKSEPRNSGSVFEGSTEMTNRVITMCAWCKRIDLEGWVEVDEAVTALNIFNDPMMPMISQGVCDDCYTRILKKPAM